MNPSVRFWPSRRSRARTTNSGSLSPTSCTAMGHPSGCVNPGPDARRIDWDTYRSFHWRRGEPPQRACRDFCSVGTRSRRGGGPLFFSLTPVVSWHSREPNFRAEPRQHSLWRSASGQARSRLRAISWWSCSSRSWRFYSYSRDRKSATRWRIQRRGFVVEAP